MAFSASIDQVTEGIKAAYDALDYDYTAYAQTHPDRLATVAALFGVDAPSPATSRILEIGCGDGANVIPMADRWPGASIVGCDLAARPVARGNAIIGDLQLGNIQLRVEDLRELPEDLGSFDYIIAHGFYSWVPPAVREALMAMIAARLSPNGVAFVSYNALPGSHVRQIAWDAMNFRTRNTHDPAQKVLQARELMQLMGEPGGTQYRLDTALREELADTDSRADSALMHDDMAVPNQPFYFHQFMAHATQHGLTYLGDAEVKMMTTAGLGANVRRFVADFDRLTAEQYLDFVRFRRFRQTLLTKASSTSNFAMLPARVRGMHVTVASSVVESMDQAEREGQPRNSVISTLDPAVAAMLRWLIDKSPATVTVQDVVRWRARHTPTDARSLEAVIAGMYAARFIALYSQPASVAVVAPDKPRASRVARRSALDHRQVVNQRHESVNLSDVHARKLLPMLDGTHDRRALLAGLGAQYDGGPDGLEAVLRFFAKMSLLVA